MSDDIATAPMATQADSGVIPEASPDSVSTMATNTAPTPFPTLEPTPNTGSLPKVSTGSLPKTPKSSKAARTKHSLNALGSDEARALAVKRRAFEEKKQKERDAAKYLAEQQQEAELDAVLKAAQAKSDAFNAALKQATATNADIEENNVKRRRTRNHLWFYAAAMFALALAAFIVNILMGG